jgi:hypothetical protein
MVALGGAFVLLEIYTMHFLMIPYYTGLIRYRPDTSLMSFHVSQALEPGLGEVVARLTVNKAPFLSSSVMVCLWALFVMATASLPVLAWRETSRKN